MVHLRKTKGQQNKTTLYYTKINQVYLWYIKFNFGGEDPGTATIIWADSQLVTSTSEIVNRVRRST